MKTGTSLRTDLPVAVVIGAGGMGMATARRLGQTHRIVLASRSSSRKAERAAMLCDEGLDAIAVPCDITDPDSVARLAHTVQAHGRFRTLAHVAALSPSMADSETILRVNLVGATRVERAMLGLATQGSVAIFVSSLAAYMVTPGAAQLAVLDDPLAPDFLRRLQATLTDAEDSALAYSLSKFAINRMCQRRAAAWGQRGGRIVSMSPGMIASPMGALEFRNQPRKIGLLARSPVPREGTLMETADALEFLASDRASFITGTDLLVDGGVGAVLNHPDSWEAGAAA